MFDLKQLAATIRKKLVMEIASLDVAPEAAPIQFAEAEPPPAPGSPGVTRVQLKLPTEKTDCEIGEKVWGGGGGGRGFRGFGALPEPVTPRPAPVRCSALSAYIASSARASTPSAVSFGLKCVMPNAAETKCVSPS